MRRLAIAFLLASCAHAELSAGGARVSTLPAAPGPECRNLGTIVGASQPDLFPLTPEGIVEAAVLDARNKAAEIGATALVLTAPQLAYSTGQYGSATRATVLTIAYRCPEGVTPAATATGVPEAAGQPSLAVPEGFRIAATRSRTAVRSAPDGSAPVRFWIDPGTIVYASDRTGRGFAAVKSQDGTAGGYVEAGSLQPDR
jgi:hypothetical protein